MKIEEVIASVRSVESAIVAWHKAKGGADKAETLYALAKAAAMLERSGTVAEKDAHVTLRTVAEREKRDEAARDAEALYHLVVSMRGPE